MSFLTFNCLLLIFWRDHPAFFWPLLFHCLMMEQGSGWIQKNRRSWPCPWSSGILPLVQGICYEKIQKKTCSLNRYAGRRRILDKRLFLKNTCLLLSLFCIRRISLFLPLRNNYLLYPYCITACKGGLGKVLFISLTAWSDCGIFKISFCEGG